MSNVWLCLPSARPAAHVAAWLQRWTAKGYKVALWRDDGIPIEGASLTMGGAYPGYAVACNELIAHVLKTDAACDWVVCCGDDTWPDPNHTADEIAVQCSAHFGYAAPDSFGVMQPTGDPYGESDPYAHTQPVGRKRYIERICGSPWLGREWCLRGNRGAGPWHPGFWHMHGDECLQEVAQKLGILWQRPDLTHYHDHWARKRGNYLDMPAFLATANSREHWRDSKALLDRLRADGFRECLPL